MARALLTLALVALSATVAGCGSGEESQRLTRTGQAQTIVLPDGSIDRAPSPFSVADIAGLPADSPEIVVTTLLFYAQWGAAPSVVELYHPDAIRAVGAERIAGAFSLARTELVTTLWRIAGVQREGRGTRVTVDTHTQGAPPGYDSFLVVRHEGEWRILHDTLLERYVTLLVSTEVQQRSEPGDTEAESAARANRAATALAKRFRDTSVEAGR